MPLMDQFVSGLTVPRVKSNALGFQKAVECTVVGDINVFIWITAFEPGMYFLEEAFAPCDSELPEPWFCWSQ